MAPRKLRIKKNYKEDNLSDVVYGADTIITALEKVLEVAINSELDEERLKNAKPEFDFLADKLSLNTMQAIIVSILIDYDAPVSTKRMANYLSVRNLRLLNCLNEFKDLLQRRIIRRKIDIHNQETAYIISPAVAKCYIRNEVYTAPSNENLTLAQFMEVVDDCFEQCDHNSLTIVELKDELCELIRKNSTLHLCKSIAPYTTREQVLFLYCCREYITKGDRHITNSQYNDYFDRADWTHLSGDITWVSAPCCRTICSNNRVAKI